MITLAIYETPAEFETLKERAKNGETIYTLLDKKTVLLLDHQTARKVGKREIDNLIGRFPACETEKTTETEGAKTDTLCEGTGSPTRDGATFPPRCCAARLSCCGEPARASGEHLQVSLSTEVQSE